MDFAAGIFVVGLILWWIVKNEIKQLGAEEAHAERKRLADEAARESEREERRLKEENAVRWRAQNMQWAREFWADEAKAEIRRIERERWLRQELNGFAEVVRLLSEKRFAIQEAQSQEGLVAISIVASLLNWQRFKTSSGETDYNYPGTVRAEVGDLFVAGTNEHPFPDAAAPGWFVAGEIILWLEMNRSLARESAGRFEIEIAKIQAERHAAKAAGADWNALISGNR